MSMMNDEELCALGFKSIGKNVSISRKASIYNPMNISIGDDVRVDDFCVLAAGVGGINIGSNVHIAVFCSLIGAGNITLSDFSGLSSRVSIYSSSDDYSGETLTNPTIPSIYKNVSIGDVRLERHVIVGAGAVILPGIVLEEGVAIAALAMVHKSCSSFGLYAGNPARRVAERKRGLLQYETQYINGKH